MTPALEARDLRATRAGRTVLDGVTLSVEAGETVLLAGPSGSGKSSLLMALAGLLGSGPSTTVEGQVRVGGLDPRTAAGPDLARRVGVLFQRPRDQLLTLDAATEVALKLDRLGLPRDEADDRARDLLERAGADHLAHRPTSTLSGGEARRVALAQALAGDPDVLLLDEPLSQLDPVGRRRFLVLLDEAARDAAVVVAEHRLQDIRPRAHRVLGLEDGRRAPPPDPPSDPPTWETPPPDAPTLELEGVTAGPGDAPVLEDLDLAVPPGLTVLAGPNGAGKTTLLRVVAGLLPPTEGRVRLAGEPLPDEARDRARLVGYAPQDPGAVFHRPTVSDEIAWGPGNLGVPCDPDAVASRHRLDAHLDRHPRTLSGGEAERLAWAAAHAHDPPVRLYDEPTTGLDPAARRVLARHLGEARRRGPVLVATHDPWLLASADRLVRLEAGAVAARGPPEEVAPRRLPDRPTPEAAGGVPP